MGAAGGLAPAAFLRATVDKVDGYLYHLGKDSLFAIEKGQPVMIVLDGENYLDGGEASTLLGVKLSTLYAYVSRGILRSYKQGIKRQRLYKQAELEALLQLRPSDAPISALQPGGGAAPQEGPEIPPAEDWVPNV